MQYFIKLTVSFFYSTSSWVSAHKMALFVPDISNSQVLFNTRVAETLAKAGHDVTMIMISLSDEMKGSYVNIMKEVSSELNRSMECTSGISFHLRSFLETVENKEFLKWLVAQKFDLAFAHIFDVCPIGLIHYAKIPSWIWLSRFILPTIILIKTSMFLFASHTKLSILWCERFSFRMFADRETAIFRELIDPNYPDLVDVASQCPLVMVNSNELYDFPRPTLAKIVNIGGVGMQFKDAQPLSSEFQQIVDNSEGLVIFSFGSVTQSHKMPLAWKNAFLEAFSRHPKLSFVMRYEGTDLKGKLPPNVHLFKWLPQADLLANPKTVAFITHGGYNSLQESITAGVPLITIALFGDQYRNVKLAEKHRFAVILRKGDINVDTIAEALQTIVKNKVYSQNVKRLSQMVRKKPLSPAHLLVSWAEFAAEFKTLDNLVPAGNKLNFFQYYSLDVIVFLSSVVAVIMFVLYMLLKFVFLKIYALFTSSAKQKKA
ncbi:unnamed protein product [Heligmosomoides polygyrus]|uniref:UDP-glucuronosyltransferase n=1 Tax=Heligmosomoides polygyrus TaxID=6339 RepID=A0A3P8FMN5_HELPZ|nr:unnamed protein product [Heligmosomoides polygyrus]